MKIETIAVVVLSGCWMATAAYGQFATQNVTLHRRLPLSQIGGGLGSDLWGWTDSLTGKDYALFARSTGLSFIDVTDGANPVYLGNLPSYTDESDWRDVKVYQDHAFVVSDGNGPHGMQVFDLTRLRGVTTPQTFNEDAHYDAFRSAHNIAINEASGFAYVVGSDRAGGGLHIVDIRDPMNPVEAGFFSADGYTHDAQVVNYVGPDTAYSGREIAFAANEDTLTIVDVTNKNGPSQLARKGYAGSAYSHQGWLSEDQRYFFLGDELDEYYFGGRTKMHVFDVSDLNNPQYVGFDLGPTSAIDHNLYVLGDYIFSANYRAGVQIYEITDAANADLTPVGFLDTFPGSNSADFNGAWSVYPYFAGGKFIVSDIERGLFVATFDPLSVSPGDFDANGRLDCGDIDLLVTAIAGASSDNRFDLDGNGSVGLEDRDTWLSLAGAQNLDSASSFLLGDADLNGAVDTSDFNIWNQAKFTSVAHWCDGDFNADGVVDASDFNIWNINKFQSSGALVPEPSGAWLGLIAVSLWVNMRRGSRCAATK